MEMGKAKMLVIFNNLDVRENEKSEPSVLILLTTNFCSNCTFESLNFPLIVKLFVNNFTTAAHPQAFLNANLSTNGARFIILLLDEGQLI